MHIMLYQSLTCLLAVLVCVLSTAASLPDKKAPSQQNFMGELNQALQGVGRPRYGKRGGDHDFAMLTKLLQTGKRALSGLTANDLSYLEQMQSIGKRMRFVDPQTYDRMAQGMAGPYDDAMEE